MPISRRWRRTAAVVLALTGALGLAACTSSGAPAAAPGTSTAPTSLPAPSVATSSSAVPTPTSTTAKPTPTRTSTHPRPKPAPTPVHATHAAPPSPAPGAPVIAVDPGHSPSIHQIDPATGLDVSDYENEPEMRDVYAVALLVKAKLLAAGYRVVMTKTSVDQAGGNGGIGFHRGNNIVYYQAVGDYRATPSGKKVYFTNAKLAATSKKFGQIFRTQRERVQGNSINLQSNTGYNLGSRGLAAGNIWLVQLLSDVPWIYNEAGGNSAGRVGLDAADKQTYASALVAGVEHCIAPPR